MSTDVAIVVGILAHREANDIPHGWALVVFDKIAAMQEDPLLPDLQKAEAPLWIPLNDFGDQVRFGWCRHGTIFNSPLKAWSRLAATLARQFSLQRVQHSPGGHLMASSLRFDKTFPSPRLCR